MRKTTISIRLPHLTGEQAYMTAFALEQIVTAIWHEYGDNMADFKGRVFPDGSPDLTDPPEDDYLDPGSDDILI